MTEPRLDDVDEPRPGATDPLLYNLVYCSCAAEDVDDEAVDRIVQTAQRRNAVEGVTGVLVFGSGIFFQWLEGPRPSVTRLMERIKGDARHWNVIELSEVEESRERLFPNWSMERVTTDAIRDVLIDAHGTARDNAQAADLLLLISRLDAGEIGVAGTGQATQA